MHRHEGIDSFPFIGYIDTLAAIVLVFVVITAFIAISFTLSSQALQQAQEDTAGLRAELDALQDAQQQINDLQAELELYRERLETAGYQNVQEIPNRQDWRDAVLTKQVLENTGWSKRLIELPMYETWQQFDTFSLEELQQLTESEQNLVELMQKTARYDEVLETAGYDDVTEIPQKDEWEEIQVRLKSYQTLLEEAGFEGRLDTLYEFLEQWNQIIVELKRIFKVDVNEPDVVLTKLQRLENLQKKVVIPVAQGSIFFGFGEVTIQDEFQQSLDKYVAEAREAIRKGTYDLIQIEGHTDAIPVRQDNPKYENNWELSSARAQAVAEYFIRKGIPPDNIAVVGHGEYKPKIRGAGRDVMAQNRRIEIVFINSSLLNVGVDEEEEHYE